ncbi:Ribosomal RNA small subunit methyltransferase E [Corynebacterium capitovis DSM 44611]|uniref:16S rRNA (uracil(1498)-N(3))-methyltransferase n=1 Tax=Corynebacterium capitovis TaxID=131081 RepID=UPI0003677ED6|nr:16S rRNA (uracil(1498)-N(3))-methyltransferase [Corynebacterium capitovis]WKD57246.1 Ribosomal RNA small subunit methyltransferase E [Corynebacterium capitovis DSM 44611]
MSLPYFLSPDPASGRLDGPEGRHAVSVKRIKPGEHIVLSDGHGTATEVRVTSTQGKDTLVGEVLTTRFVDPPVPHVTVVQAIPKGERAELAVDLAVQGGADRIVPWVSQRTVARWPVEKRAKQVEKWRAVAAAAAKQARRAWVPEVTEPVTTRQLRGMLEGRQALVLHEDAQVPLRDIDFAPEVFLLVGPEGGIGAEELAELGGQAVRLGPEVVRTAAAAFAALNAIGALTARW